MSPASSSVRLAVVQRDKLIFSYSCTISGHISSATPIRHCFAILLSEYGFIFWAILCAIKKLHRTTFSLSVRIFLNIKRWLFNCSFNCLIFSYLLRPRAQFCCKMWGDSLVWNQWSHRVDAEVMFYKYKFPILFIKVF